MYSIPSELEPQPVYFHTSPRTIDSSSSRSRTYSLESSKTDRCSRSSSLSSFSDISRRDSPSPLCPGRDEIPPKSQESEKKNGIHQQAPYFEPRASITINEQNRLGQTLAHWAAHHANDVILSSLAKREADLNRQATFFWEEFKLEKVTPLHLTAIFGHISSLNVLLRQNVEIDLQVPKLGNVLHLAIYFQKSDLFRHLLTEYFQKIKPLLSATKSNGFTPFELGVHLGNFKILNILGDTWHNQGNCAKAIQC